MEFLSKFSSIFVISLPELTTLLLKTFTLAPHNWLIWVMETVLSPKSNLEETTMEWYSLGVFLKRSLEEIIFDTGDRMAQRPTLGLYF